MARGNTKRSPARRPSRGRTTPRRGKPAGDPKAKELRWQEQDPAVTYADGQPIPEPYSSFVEAYSAHVWVYVCVRAIARNAASVDVLPYRPTVKNGETNWEVFRDHPFYDLLNSPNPYMSGYQLRLYTYAFKKLTGNAYWFLQRNDAGTDIEEIWPLLPDQVQPVSTRERMVDHYLYSVNGKKIPLDYREVIHFSEFNPKSFSFGQGAISAAMNTITTDLFSQMWNKSFFHNSAEPSGVLETEHPMKEEARRRVLDSWRTAHQGAANRGKTAILEGGLKYRQISSSIKDMDFVNLRRDMRLEVLATMGVPPSVVGLLEYANYSNMKEQNRMFWNETLLPEIRDMADTITMRAGQEEIDFETEFQGDTSKVQALQPDLKLQADTLNAFVTAGVPLNRVIEMMDLPLEAVEGGDEPRSSAPAFPGLSFTPPDVKAGGKDEDADRRETVRSAAWKRFDGELRAREDEFEIGLRGFFKGQRRRVLERINDLMQSLLAQADTAPTPASPDELAAAATRRKAVEDTVELAFDLESEAERMKSVASRSIRGTYFDFALRMARRVDPNFDFNLDDPAVVAFLEAKESRLVLEANRYTLEQISRQTAEAIQDAIAQGVSQSETIAQVTDRISSVYDFAVDHRAERIARTEVIGAANAGNNDALVKTGAESKSWLSSRDSRVRETHRRLDGAEVPVQEAFISPGGGRLKFPGDPDGPPDEVVNCRCTVVPGGED